MSTQTPTEPEKCCRDFFVAPAGGHHRPSTIPRQGSQVLRSGHLLFQEQSWAGKLHGHGIKKNTPGNCLKGLLATGENVVGRCLSGNPAGVDTRETLGQVLLVRF